MNKFFIMMIGLLFTASAVLASPNAKADFVTLDKADSQVLFGDSAVSVVALGHDEMMATEGEWAFLVPMLKGAIVALVVGWASGTEANAPSWNEPVGYYAPQNNWGRW